MCTLSSLYLFSGKRIVRLHEPDFFVSALPLLSQQKGQPMKNHIKRNYNGKEIKTGEVFVPIMYGEFAKAYCKNPDCIKTVSVGGRKFKVMYIAVPKEIAKAACNSFNLAVNEALGHYVVKNSVSADELKDLYELVMETSPEDELTEKEEKHETIDLITYLIHQLIEQSSKHGLAALLLISDIKGKEFHEKMHLGHDATNTVRKQVEDFLRCGLVNIDINGIHSKKSKNTAYYREEAYHLLDALLKMYNA